MLVFELLASSAMGEGFDLRVIAATGDPAPLAGANAKYLYLRSTAADAAGDVAFVGGIDAPGVTDSNRDMLLVANSDGTSHVVARQGASPLGAPANTTFGNFNRELLMNDSGNLAFANQMISPGGGGNAYQTIWSDVGGLHLADSAVKTASSFDSGDFTFLGIVQFDSVGRILYRKDSQSSSGQVINDGPHSFWISPGKGVAHAVVTTGDMITLGNGTQPPITFSFFSYQASLKSGGQVVFGAQMTGSGINTLNDDTIWADDNGYKQILMRDGQSAPGLPNGTIMTHIEFPYADAAGHLAFSSPLSGPDVNLTNSEAVFSTTGGALHLVARDGQTVPGIGFSAKFGSVTNVFGVAGDATLFRSEWDDLSGHANEGYFAERGNKLSAVVYENQPAPGMDAGYTMGLMACSIQFRTRTICSSMGREIWQ